MFGKSPKKDKRTNLEKEIDSVLDVMSDIRTKSNIESQKTPMEALEEMMLETLLKTEPGTKEYAERVQDLERLRKVMPEKPLKAEYIEAYSEMAKNLELLYKTKANDKKPKVSPDTVALIAANLLGIGLILWHEKADVITTKALGFIIKGKI